MPVENFCFGVSGLCSYFNCVHCDASPLVHDCESEYCAVAYSAVAAAGGHVHGLGDGDCGDHVSSSWGGVSGPIRIHSKWYPDIVDPATGTAGFQETNGWVSVDLGEPVVLGAVKVNGGCPSGGGCPSYQSPAAPLGDWEVQGSNDRTTWATVGTCRQELWWDSDVGCTDMDQEDFCFMDATSTTPYQVYRFYASAWQSEWFIMTELQVLVVIGDPLGPQPYTLSGCQPDACRPSTRGPVPGYDLLSSNESDLTIADFSVSLQNKPPRAALKQPGSSVIAPSPTSKSQMRAIGAPAPCSRLPSPLLRAVSSKPQDRL